MSYIKNYFFPGKGTIDTLILICDQSQRGHLQHLPDYHWRKSGVMLSRQAGCPINCKVFISITCVVEAWLTELWRWGTFYWPANQTVYHNIPVGFYWHFHTGSWNDLPHDWGSGIVLQSWVLPSKLDLVLRPSNSSQYLLHMIECGNLGVIRPTELSRVIIPTEPSLLSHERNMAAMPVRRFIWLC